MRASPKFLPGLVLVAALVGCQRAEPLDWKVSAKTPAHYDEWHDNEFPRLSPVLQQEFTRAFTFIASTAPRARTVDENAWTKTGNPLCRRLDGRTVRRLLLDGYDLEKRALLARISTESDNILRNVKLTEKIENAETLRKFDRARLAQTAGIEGMSERLRVIELRIKELSPR